MYKIALIGNSQSGKTTTADFFKEFFEEKDITEVVNLKFADPMFEYLDCIGRGKVREFMQDLGDLTKKHYGEGIFIESLTRSDAVLCTNEPEDWQFPPICDVITIDDVRTKLEFDTVLALGYTTVYIDSSIVTRAKRSSENGVGLNDAHNSESEVSSLKDKSIYFFECGFVCFYGVLGAV